MRLGADDLFRLRWLSDPRFSPDGLFIAYVETRLDRRQDRSRTRVRIIARDGSPIRGPFESIPDARAPRWSSDGRLAVIESGSGRDAVVVLDSGTGRVAAKFPVSGLADAPVWSADGKRIAFAVAPAVQAPGSSAYSVTTPAFKLDGVPAGSHRDPSRVMVAHIAGNRSLAIDGGGSDERSPAWLADGRLAYVADWSRREPGRRWSALMLTDFESQPVTLLPGLGLIEALTTSPDGRWITWCGRERGEDAGQDSAVWVMTPEGDSQRSLTATLGRCIGMVPRADDPRGIGDIRLEWRGGYCYFRYAEGGRGRVARVGFDGEVESVLVGDRTILDFSLGLDSEIAFVASDPSTPGELSILDAGGERRLSKANAWLAGLELATTEYVKAVAADGRRLDAWITLPPAPRNLVPLILSVHGGPHHPVGWRFWFEAQRLAARGFAVLTGNPRGSQGYGESFARLVYGDWGGGDLEDLVAILDTALRSPGLDPDRVAITGVSYGGYMANWAVTRTDRFRAAISENGITDLASKYGTGADAGVLMAVELDGTPWTQPERYSERSPLTHADRIRTPLLLIHAELDAVCPIQQSEQLFVALTALGREVEFHRLPGEGHLINLVGRPSHRLQRAAAVDRWFDRHLAPLDESAAMLASR